MFARYVDGFLIHRESDGRSYKTISGHRKNLSLFHDWLVESQISSNPQDWDSTTIRSYFVHLRNRESIRGGALSGYSIRNYAVTIRAFCRWLHDEEITERNAAERVSAPKAPHLVKEPFVPGEVRRLLESSKSDKRTGIRDTAILLFLLDTGCRAAEVVGLELSEVLWSQRMAKVIGKGNKERVVFVSPETAKAMQRYALKRSEQSPSFFQTEEGHQLTTTGLLRIVKKLGLRSNVADAHPHRFRHTFAVTYLRAGGNPLVLQRLMGHTTLAMTNRYVALLSDDLQKDHQQFSPVSKMLARH